MKYLVIIFCSGCIVSGLNPKERVMEYGCIFPTRSGSTDLTYLCEHDPKVYNANP
jgi:hypothetical protein